MQVKKQQLELYMKQQTGFKSGKACIKAMYLFSPCSFILYAEYIMWNSWLDEAQAGIKIAERTISSLRYADDPTPLVESEELKSFLMKVKKESGNAGLKLNIQKMKIMAFGPIIPWQIDGETMETVRDFIFFHSKITADEIKDICSLEQKL